MINSGADISRPYIPVDPEGRTMLETELVKLNKLLAIYIKDTLGHAAEVDKIMDNSTPPPRVVTVGCMDGASTFDEMVAADLEQRAKPHCPLCGSYDVCFDAHAGSATCVACHLSDYGVHVDWFTNKEEGK